MQQFTIKKAISMKALGRRVAKKCSGGTVIALSGSLGAGKTVFTKGFVSAFGVKEHVISPTFTLLQEYDAGDVTICHFDLYRLGSADEFGLIGGMERICDSSVISLIEWPGLVDEYLDAGKTIRVNIEVCKDKSRLVTIDGAVSL